jgi:DNA-binding beta-propeller fold protein YncE
MLKNTNFWLNPGYKTFLILFILCLSGCAVEQKKTDFKIPVFPPPPDEPRFYYEKTLSSSADVVPEDDDFSMKSMLTGVLRTGEGMSKPYDVSVYKGTIYVADPVERNILVFDKTGKRFFRIGNESPGLLRKPFGIDQDKDGNVYVIDAREKIAYIYDKEGKFKGNIGSKELFDRPTGIAVTEDGSRLFIVDTGGVSSTKHQVRVFDVKTKKHLFDIGKRGNKEGEFNLPKGATINPVNGLLYVVDSGNFRIQAFNTEDGAFVSTFGKIGRFPGTFARPKDISSDAEGNIYVTDAAFGNFQIFNTKGQLLLYVGNRSQSNVPAKFMLPSGIDVDEDGRVLMADQYFKKIEIYRPARLDTTQGYLGTFSKGKK